MPYLWRVGTSQHFRVYRMWYALATKAAKGTLSYLQCNRIRQLGDLSQLWT